MRADVVGVFFMDPVLSPPLLSKQLLACWSASNLGRGRKTQAEFGVSELQPFGGNRIDF